MPVIPKIPKQVALTRKCNKCGAILSSDSFTRTHSPFYPDGYLPICNGCVNEILKAGDYSWDCLDRFCQYAGIPWIVKEWTRIVELNGEAGAWAVYSNIFANEDYQNFGWADYNAQYIKLREKGMVADELPLISEAKMARLRRDWGSNYSDEDLYYLEDLYKGLKLTQNVNGALQEDQARKICKLSLEIDSRIRAGDKEVDKFLSSYDKLVKAAEFTPKNTKNAIDFDSFAEVGYWLEKRGRQNKFYDNVTRDVIDETIKNIQSYNQRLYVNEGGIGDEITERLKSLSNMNAMESNLYDIQKDFDADKYDNDGFAMNDEEDFDAEAGEDEQ